MKILIICTGNSCRSQIAAGFLRSFDDRLDVYSAGTDPATEVNRNAILVMAEADIDISKEKPVSVEPFLDDHWEFVITVCDDADLSCPVFEGDVRFRIHMGFEDPSRATGTDEHVINEFRRIRDEIQKSFLDFYQKTIRPLLPENEDADEYFNKMLNQYIMPPPSPFRNE